jgi:hypothetical protein
LKLFGNKFINETSLDLETPSVLGYERRKEYKPLVRSEEVNTLEV